MSEKNRPNKNQTQNQNELNQEKIEKNKQDKQDVKPEAAQESNEPTPAPDTEEKQTEEKKPEVDVEKLVAQLTEKDAKLLRLQADFENFRRRTRKEKEEIGDVVTQEIIKDLLPLLDNFERALNAKTDGNEKHLRTGIEMVYKQFCEVLKNHGMEAIETKGKKFDPNFHQAVMRVEAANDDMEDGDIAMELQKGYVVRGHVIRPSMVQVVAK